MDFDCIEMLLDLPEFHLIHLTFGDHQLHLHLQRQERTIVCPRCQRVCERIKESRTRCIRDLPIFERPVMLWLQIRRFQCQPCQLRPWEVSETFDAPGQVDGAALPSSKSGKFCKVVQGRNWLAAMVSPNARCFDGRLKRVVADDVDNSVAPSALMNIQDAKDTTTIP